MNRGRRCYVNFLVWVQLLGGLQIPQVVVSDFYPGVFVNMLSPSPGSELLVDQDVQVNIVIELDMKHDNVEAKK